MLDGDGWSASGTGRFTHGDVCRDIEREAGWATEPVYTFKGVNNIALAENRSSNCRMCTNSVYGTNLFIVRQSEKIQYLKIHALINNSYLCTPNMPTNYIKL